MLACMHDAFTFIVVHINASGSSGIVVFIHHAASTSTVFTCHY